MGISSPWRESVTRALQFAVAVGVLLLPASVLAQDNAGTAPKPEYFGDENEKGLYGLFRPAFEVEPTPRSGRSGTAEVSKYDEAELTKRGYVKIGAIEASEPYAAGALQDAILTEAATVGGDVVYFTKSAAPAKVAISVGKVSPSCAVYTDGLAVNHTGNCLKWDTGRIIGYKTKYVNGFVSEGTVWGDDPRLVFEVAILSGDLAIVEADITHDPGLVTEPNAHGKTPLHIAAASGRKAAAEVLLAHGASVTAEDGTGATPLHLAAVGGYANVAELLLAHGAPISAGDKAGAAPLHLAAFGDHKAVVELLLAHEAEINAKSNNGTTPLVSAVFGVHKDMAEFLLAKGADVNALDSRGWTPLKNAKHNGYRTREAKELIELIRQHGGHE